MGTQGDAHIFRRVVAMNAADRRQIAAWSAALCGTATVLQWLSADLQARSAAAQVTARALCEQAKALLRTSTSD
jgi:hypothetical protein